MTAAVFMSRTIMSRMYGCDIVQRLTRGRLRGTVHSSLRLPVAAAERFGLWRIEHGRIREEIIFHCTAV
ncbi:MAG: hypothetical protein HC929_11620 [Leptolyngbyaceae cyanobacterium SM2_5_2]|nr:hypothetical protein [Leptolyngbyaceae cyanobacterium SM2_5_2]